MEQATPLPPTDTPPKYSHSLGASPDSASLPEETQLGEHAQGQGLIEEEDDLVKEKDRFGSRENSL